MDLETASLRNRLRLSAKRAQKSCGPCRARKLKCDRDAPCIRCIRSGYPDLCLYDERVRPSKPPVSSRHQAFDAPSANAQRCDSSRTSQALEALHDRLGTAGRPDLSQTADQTDRSPFLGANSLPNFLDRDGDVIRSPEDVTRQRARDAMMPMLGVAPSVPGYPFYGPNGDVEEHAIARLFRSLPPSRDVIR